MDVSGGIRERVRCLSGLEMRAFALRRGGRQRNPLSRFPPPSREGGFLSGGIGMGNVSGKFLLLVYKQCPRRRQCWITIF